MPEPSVFPQYDASGLPINDPDDSLFMPGQRDAEEIPAMTQREWHLTVAYVLDQLHCTFPELQQMAEDGRFTTRHHEIAWGTFGRSVDLGQLNRAQVTLEMLSGEDPFGLDDAAIERLEQIPDDRITGAPYHVIINGDHDACACGGHLTTCETWNIPYWRHKATICGITRTLCIHEPRHTYSEPCGEYNEPAVATEWEKDPAGGGGGAPAVG